MAGRRGRALGQVLGGLVVSCCALGEVLRGADAAATFERFNGSIVVGCCSRPGANGTGVVSAGTTDTQDACEALCAASDQCTGYTWESANPAGGKQWALACLLRTDGEFDLREESGQFSGRKPCPGPSGTGGNYTPTWCSVTSHPMPNWFEDAKFGIYAHFGPYSVPAYGSEWYSRNMYVNGSDVWKHHVGTYGESFGYKDFIPQFTTPKFNASEWAAIYFRAGARYAGPVAEHADGFAMFNSSISHYNAVEMGPKRDIVGELAEAIRSNGMRLVTTMHHEWLFDWFPTWDPTTDAGNPEYELTDKQGGLYGPKVAEANCTAHFLTSEPCIMTQRFNDYFNGKVFEVVDQYHPDVLYFDSRLGLIDEQHRLDFVSHYYNADLEWQKQGTSSGVIVTYKNEDLEVGAGALDYERGGSNNVRPDTWQTDDAMDRRSWSWVDPPNLKNETELIPELIDIVSKNGNLLLDIPPHADGSIDPVIQNTLFAIGDWLDVNGQAIFATKPWWNGTYGEGPTQITPGSFHEWPIFTSEDFRFTTKDKVLFATALAWAEDGNFHIKSINTSTLHRLGQKISSVALVGASDQKVNFNLKEDGLHITSLSKPASVEHAFAFRIHLDSDLGFVAWDRPRLEDQHIIQPGCNNTLRWLSGANDVDGAAAEEILLQRWVSAEGRWKPLDSDGKPVPNTGVYIWNAPAVLESPLLLRVKAAFEDGVEHIVQLPVHMS